NTLTRNLVSLPYGYRGPDASVTLDGLHYGAPVVLAAGFDYNGRLPRILKHVGFGGVEVGSVTARAAEGNPPPRLIRLVRSGSLVVNKGLRNDGVIRIAERLQRMPREPGFVLGISIARSNDPDAASMEGGIADYHAALSHLASVGVGDYYTINLSCPNVFAGESFAEPSRLRALLQRLVSVEHGRPLYAKMPINPPWKEFAALLDVIDECGLNGVVIGNLNKDYSALERPEEAPPDYRGGLSGRPCAALSTDLIRRTREAYGSRFSIIGCGGIMTPQDALEKLRAGADLVQLISGMIFEGPHLMKQIARAYAHHKAAARAV
ncbi:MAG: quinone-dependent dihydroorotate dehydrogenase, partial [Gemmatimonas sp.]|nr:quinone-dependent dihydroorotate dehydrogenase [Gemmatimonas sp.]